MNSGVDTAYLRYQYDDSEKLRIRIETHARYSERTEDTWRTWLLQHVDARPGHIVLDVGCGPGVYHHPLLDASARVAGIDASPGMAREARDANADAAIALASAEHLPYRDGAFDRLMANHIMYHVPDQRAALVEFRRVLKQGGRAVVSTNGAENFIELDELHRLVAAHSGYTPIDNEARRFTLDHLSLVQASFPTARLFVRNDAFVFHEAEPALRFYSSGGIDAIEDRPADGSHRALMLREMGELIDAIIAREGVFRVSKVAGCYVADV